MVNALHTSTEASPDSRLRRTRILPLAEAGATDWGSLGLASAAAGPLASGGSSAVLGQAAEALTLELAESLASAAPPSGLPQTAARLADTIRACLWRQTCRDAPWQQAIGRSDAPGSEPLEAQRLSAGPATVPAEATAAQPNGSWVCITSPGGSPRLWRYVLNGQNSAIDNGLETVLLTHGWLGSGVTSAPSSPLGFNPGLHAAAVNLASASRQVLFLDWGQQAIDPNPAGLAPYNAAGRINSVAAWAKAPLQSLADSGATLTLVGFSLGSYVVAQTAVQLGSGSNLRLVALEPAAAGLRGAYDLDSANNSADPVPNLAGTTPSGSLAFVVADTNLSIGLAADNTRAGTAQHSFLVRGFASGTSATDAHGAIPALYADLARYLAPEAAITTTILSGFRTNQYSNSGTRSGIRPHEGIVTLRNNQSAIARLDGFTATGATQTVVFVDAQESVTPTGSSSSQDTLVALRDVQLASSASVERVVLGGSAAIGATGNSAVQELIGNAAANRLEGRGNLDRLTGGDGPDTFVYAALSDALVGGSRTLRSFERITDFDVSQDRIDAPGSTQRSLTDLGSVGSLSDIGLRGLLTSGNFGAGAAALFRWGSGAGERLLLGLNDANPGFDPLFDGIIELTGLQGDPLSLLVS